MSINTGILGMNVHKKAAHVPAPVIVRQTISNVNQNEVSELHSQIDFLRSQLSEVKGLKDTIAVLHSKLADVQGVADSHAALVAKVDELTSKVADASLADSHAALVAKVDELTSKVADASSKVAEVTTSESKVVPSNVDETFLAYKNSLKTKKRGVF